MDVKIAKEMQSFQLLHIMSKMECRIEYKNT